MLSLSSPQLRRIRHRAAFALLAAAFSAGSAAPRAWSGAVEVASVPLDDAFYNVGSTFGFYPHAPMLATRRDGARLYVPLGSYADELAVFDVTDPRSPSVVRAPGLPARALAASGTLVYAVDGNTLRIADLADPAAPVLLRTLPLNGGASGAAAIAVRLHRAGERRYAFVTGGGPFLGDFPALRAFDVTDPANAAPVGYGTAETGGSDLAIAGTTACVASYGAGLRCYDVADPAHPVLRGATGTLGVATALALRSGIAYVLNAGASNAPLRASLVAVDVRNPARPTLLGVASIPADFLEPANGSAPYYGLQLSGDLLYAGSPYGVLAFDVADPAAPRLLERFGPGALTTGAKRRDGLLLAVSTDGLHVLEAAPEAALPPVCGEAGSTPACLAPGESARLSLPLFRSYDPASIFFDGVHPAAYANGVLHVPMGASGLVSVDVAGAAPRLLAHTTGAALYDVAADGDRLYGVDENTLTVLDVAQPERPVVLGVLDGPLGFGAIPAAIAVHGGRAVVTGGWYPSEKAVRVFDVADPSAITELGSLDGVPGLDVALADDLAFVASRRGLQIFDVAQPAAIAQLGETGTLGAAVRVVLAPPYAYVLNAGDGDLSLAAVDATDPSAPVLADVLAIPRPASLGLPYLVSPLSFLDLAVAGDTLFVGTATGAIAVDVGDPHAVRLVGPVGPDLFARALAVAGDRVAIATDAGVSFAPLALAGVCDANADTFLDRTDVGVIADARGEPAASLTDPRDADRDGAITTADALRCIDACADTDCLPPPRAPACRAPGETGRLDVAWFGILTNAFWVNGTAPRPPLRMGDALWEPTGAFHGNGLHAFDVSDPDHPRPLASLASLTSHAVAAAGEWLVSVDASRLSVVDVRDPRAPRVAGGVDVGPGLDAMAVAGAPGRAYVAAYSFSASDTPALRVVDVSDPEHPALIGASQETVGYDVAVGGSHAYVARGEVTVFDLADETQPAAVASIDLPLDARHVELDGDLLVVMGWAANDRWYEVAAVDVSDPAAPLERSRVAIPRTLYQDPAPFGRGGAVAWLSVAGSRAFAASTRGAIAIDLSDPDAIAVLGAVGDAAWTGGVAAAGDRLLVVNQHGVQALAADPLLAGPPGCPAPPRPCGLFGIEPLLLVGLLAARARGRARRAALIGVAAALLPSSASWRRAHGGARGARR
ncbi:MAG: hypothetical protein DCC71_16455 [Proteobacteria bacterium]|nr:MAG: hypothetical protein DCC71_16455 [Pseudomonadota bacterium]